MQDIGCTEAGKRPVTTAGAMRAIARGMQISRANSKAERRVMQSATASIGMNGMQAHMGGQVPREWVWQAAGTQGSFQVEHKKHEG